MNRFRVNLGPPESGWLSIVISGDGSRLKINASYTPKDSFADLVAAVHRVYLSEEPAVAVTFNEEPVQTVLRLNRNGNDLVVECSSEDTRQMIRADFETGCREFARRFMLLLKEVDYDEFVAAWHHRPPRERIRELWSHFER